MSEEKAVTGYVCEVTQESNVVLGHAIFMKGNDGKLGAPTFAATDALEAALMWERQLVDHHIRRLTEQPVSDFQELAEWIAKEHSVVRLGPPLPIFGKSEPAYTKYARLKPQPDMINSPPHYATHASGVECIDVADGMDFLLGNAFKYLFRRDSKGSPIADLRKSIWYLRRATRDSDAELPGFDIGPHDAFFWEGMAHYERVKLVRRVLRHESGNIANAMGLVVRAYTQACIDGDGEQACNDILVAISFIEAEIAARTSEAA